MPEDPRTFISELAALRVLGVHTQRATILGDRYWYRIQFQRPWIGIILFESA